MPSAVQAQINEKSDTVTASLLDIRGINISTDLFGYAYSILDNYSSGEVAITVKLGDK